VTAAVLLYRAVTYLPPIPLGAAAFLLWRHAPALIHAAPASSAPASSAPASSAPASSAPASLPGSAHPEAATASAPLQ
jgi:hypothetical protein